jgi:hypothetical protein
MNEPQVRTLLCLWFDCLRCLVCTAIVYDDNFVREAALVEESYCVL